MATINQDALESTALVGTDLVVELKRQTLSNRRQATTFAVLVATCAVLAGVIVHSLVMRPDPVRITIDVSGRAIPLNTLPTADPLDRRVLGLVGDCMHGLLNASFLDYQTTVGRTIGDCFTGGGTDAVRKEIDPFLAKMKATRLNLYSEWKTLPFIDTRSGGSPADRVFRVRGQIAVGYRGESTVERPVLYNFEALVVRVPYESSIQGIRVQSVSMTQQGVS